MSESRMSRGFIAVLAWAGVAAVVTAMGIVLLLAAIDSPVMGVALAALGAVSYMLAYLPDVVRRQ